MDVADTASSSELDPSVPQPPNPISQASTDLAGGRDGAAPPPSGSFKNGGATTGGATPELPPSINPCRAVSVTRTWSGQNTESGSCYGALPTLPALPSLIPPYKEREKDAAHDSDEDSCTQRAQKLSYRRRIMCTPPQPGLIASLYTDDAVCVSPTSAHTSSPKTPTAAHQYEPTIPTVSTFSIVDCAPLPLEALQSVVPPAPTVPTAIKALQSTFCPPPITLSTPFGDVRAFMATAGTPAVSATHTEVALANYQSPPASSRNCPHVGNSPRRTAAPSESTRYSSTPGPNEQPSESLPARKHDVPAAAGGRTLSESVTTVAAKSKSTNLESFLAASAICDASDCRPGVPDMLDEAERTLKHFCIKNRGSHGQVYTVDFVPPMLQHAMRELAIQLGFSRRSMEPLVPPTSGAAMGTPGSQAAWGATDAEPNPTPSLRLGSLFRSDTGIREGDELRLRPVVFYSLSHHRVQHMFWKDIDCTCVCIPEDSEGHPDLEILDAQLQRHSAARLLLAIFPAASAATGALTDVAALCKALHRRGALAAIDFATPRAPAAAIAASGCLHESSYSCPDAAIVSAGALAGRSEAAYALVYCQAGIAESTMVAPPLPSESFMQEPSPFRTLSIDAAVHHTNVPKPPLPPPHPTSAAIASAHHILDCHASTDMQAVNDLCSAYAERARTVWGLCPAVMMIGPEAGRGATAKFATGVPPRSAADLHAMADVDDIDIDQLVSISELPSPTQQSKQGKGPGGKSAPAPFWGESMHGELNSRLAELEGEQLAGGVAEGAVGGREAQPAEGLKPASSTVSFCVVARCGKLALASDQDDLKSPGVEEVLPFERQLLSHQFVASVLRDMYGIQVLTAADLWQMRRTIGCPTNRTRVRVQVSCVSATSGPFGLPLLEPVLACLNATNATVLQNHLIASRCLPDRHAPPGWCQVHFSHLMRPYEVDYIIRAVAEVGAHAWKLLPLYKLDPCTGEFYHHSRSPKPLSGLKAATGSSPGATPATHATRLDVLSSGSAGLMATASDPRMLPSVGVCDATSIHSAAQPSTTPSATPEAVGPHAVTGSAAEAMKPQMLNAEPCCSDYDSSVNGALSPQALGAATSTAARTPSVHNRGSKRPGTTAGEGPSHPSDAALLKEGVAAVSSYEPHDAHACYLEPTHADTVHASMPSTLHPCSVRDMETTPPTSQGPMASNAFSSLNRQPSTLLTSTTSCEAAAHSTAAWLRNSGSGAGSDGGDVGPSQSVLAAAKEQTVELGAEGAHATHTPSMPMSMKEAYTNAMSAHSTLALDASLSGILSRPNETLLCNRHKFSSPAAMQENDENSSATLQGAHSQQVQAQMQHQSMLLLQPEVGSVADSESSVLTPNAGTEAHSRSGLNKTASGMSSVRHIFQRTSTVAEDALLELLAAQESVATASAVQDEKGGEAAPAQHAATPPCATGAVSMELDAGSQPKETEAVSAAPSGAMTPIKGSQASDSASLQLLCMLPAANIATRGTPTPENAPTAQGAAAATVDGMASGAHCGANAGPQPRGALETPGKLSVEQEAPQQRAELRSEKSPELLLGGFPDQAGAERPPIRSSSEELRTELVGICAAATAAFKHVGKKQSILDAAAAATAAVGRGSSDSEVEELAGYYLDAAAAATAVQKGVDLGAWAFDCTEEEAHNLQKLHLWMKHACLRARGDLPTGPSDPHDPSATAAGAPHPTDAASNPGKAAVGLPSTPELPEDKNGSTKRLLDVSGKVGGSSSQSAALKQSAGDAVPVKTSASRLSVPLVGSGNASGKNTGRQHESGTSKKLPICLRCCFAPPSATS